MAENVTTLTNPSVRTINDDSDAYFGLTFPLRYKAGSTGFFPRAKNVIEQASSNIKNLLLTRKGERVGQPNFGSDLFNVIFDFSIKLFNASILWFTNTPTGVIFLFLA